MFHNKSPELGFNLSIQPGAKRGRVIIGLKKNSVAGGTFLSMVGKLNQDEPT